MIVGIDIGSRNVKIVASEAGEIQWKKLFSTVSFYRDFGQIIESHLHINFDKLSIPPQTSIIATGYGKGSVLVKNAKTLSELIAHVSGSIAQTGLDNFIAIDMGGQDFKVMQVKNARMVEMNTNARCAASSGRFLEHMASILEIPLEEMAQYHTNPIHLSSTCAIFAESELHGKIAEGTELPELIAGINHSLVDKVLPFIQEIGIDGPYIFTGGCALNKALVRIFEEKLESKIIIPEDPLFNAAIGCIAFDSLRESKRQSAEGKG